MPAQYPIYPYTVAYERLKAAPSVLAGLWVEESFGCPDWEHACEASKRIQSQRDTRNVVVRATGARESHNVETPRIVAARYREGE